MPTLTVSFDNSPFRRDNTMPRIPVVLRRPSASRGRNAAGLVDTGSTLVAAPRDYIDILGLTGGAPHRGANASGARVRGVLIETEIELIGDNRDLLIVTCEVFYSPDIREVLLGKRQFLERLTPPVDYSIRQVTLVTNSAFIESFMPGQPPAS